MAAKTSIVSDWIKRYLKEEAPRSKSLMVSAFGDSIAPLSPGIWLGDLIALMAPLGLNERLVRTSAFRLVEERWLEARREGRRSYYSLTESGIGRFELAYGRIYTPPPRQWDGFWTLVLLARNGETQAERLDLRRELEWEGFAMPTPGVMLHPAIGRDTLQQILRDRGMQDRVLVMRAQSIAEFTTEPVNGLVARWWDLSEVEALYRRFIARFGPLRHTLGSATLPAEQAFTVQTLLIHSFRRASLHDPRLPVSMLPTNWPGTEAFELARDLYQLTYRSARSHLQAIMQDLARARPGKLGEHVRERFGGLR